MNVKFIVNPAHTYDLSPILSDNGSLGVWVSIGPTIYPYPPTASLDEIHISAYGDIFFNSSYSLMYGAFSVMVWGALADA